MSNVLLARAGESFGFIYCLPKLNQSIINRRQNNRPNAHR